MQIRDWLTALAVLLTAGSVLAAYPERAIRIIVPYAPGGNIDITARTIVPGMSAALGQQIVVDNRGGAGGTLGTDLAAKSAPDGYTLLLGSTGTLSTAPPLYPKLPYDPVRDFATTSLVSNVPLVLEMHPSIPARSVKEFIALAKSRPGQPIKIVGVGPEASLAALVAGCLSDTAQTLILIKLPASLKGLFVQGVYQMDAPTLFCPGLLELAEIGHLKALAGRERVGHNLDGLRSAGV